MRIAIRGILEVYNSITNVLLKAIIGRETSAYILLAVRSFLVVVAFLDRLAFTPPESRSGFFK